ncbi:MAG: ferritin family protein [Candidatus Korobacteraceae bacterium]
MKRSFTALSPQETLHVAIFIEERNAELYHHFAELFVEFRDCESLEIAGVFWEMAIEERRHSSLLQAKYTEEYGNRSCSLTEEDLVDLIEVPRLEDGDLFAGDTRPTPGARDRALQVALKAEIGAQLFYASLAQTTQDRSLRKVYQELAQMEDGHVGFLEAKLEQNFNLNPDRESADENSIQ